MFVSFIGLDHLSFIILSNETFSTRTSVPVETDAGKRSWIRFTRFYLNLIEAPLGVKQVSPKLKPYQPGAEPEDPDSESMGAKNVFYNLVRRKWAEPCRKVPLESKEF